MPWLHVLEARHEQQIYHIRNIQSSNPDSNKSLILSLLLFRENIFPHI